MKICASLLLYAAGQSSAQLLPAGSPASLLQSAPAQIRLPQREIWRTDDWSGPAPTNRWWSSLLWERYSMPVWADPISLRARADGLAFGWPQLEVSPDGFSAPHRDSVRLTVPGLSADAALVSGFSDWTVDVRWSHASGPALEATIMKGSPYLWFSAAAGTVRISGARLISMTELAGRQAVQFSDGTDRTWLLALPADASVQVEGTIDVNFGAERDFAIAAAPAYDRATLELLALHAFTRPGQTTADWQWLRNEGVVQVDFDLGSSAPLLSGLYPHQYRRSDQELTDLSYATPRGQLRLALTTGFSTRLPFDGVLPALPGGELATEAAEHLNRYVNTTSRMFGLMPGQTRESDSYSDGKSFGRLASLLTIAEQLKNEEAAGVLVAEMKQRLESWFTAVEPPWLYYDDVWGTVLASPTSHGHDHQLNDHPFHYGYFLQAAASVAERDPGWAAAWGPAVDLLVRDTAAGRGDPQFPFLRAVDPYTGHGWASGSGRYDRGNNLESSSEAINHAAGLLRWAEATGDAELTELAAYLYASQVDAVHQYWFAAGGNFPDGFDRQAVGIVWSDGGAYNTWWTDHPGAIHGINFLPITAASAYLARDRQFVLDNFHDMTADTAHYWEDIALQYLALADPDAALRQWTEVQAVEFGETRAKTLWYLSSLASNGTPVAGIWSGFAQSGVLENAAGRTYVAFNAADEARDVNFSDGVTFRVPVRSLGEHFEKNRSE